MSLLHSVPNHPRSSARPDVRPACIALAKPVQTRAAARTWHTLAGPLPFGQPVLHPPGLLKNAQMASDNPWLSNETDAAPLVSPAPVANPLVGGRFGARAAPTNAFEPVSGAGGWDVPSEPFAAPAPAPAPATRGAAVMSSATNLSPSSVASSDLHRREEELRKKEEELERRFSNLRLREAELGVSKNWPVYFKWYGSLPARPTVFV